jgi:hypothetical protein
MSKSKKITVREITVIVDPLWICRLLGIKDDLTVSKKIEANAALYEEICDMLYPAILEDMAYYLVDFMVKGFMTGHGDLVNKTIKKLKENIIWKE